MARQTHWYSVIQFQPNVLRGERINIGLIFHQPDSGELYFQILNEDNLKIKHFLSDAKALKVYKAHKDYCSYFLEQINKDAVPVVGNVTGPSTLDVDFLSKLKDVMPESLFFSEPTFVMTENRAILFDRLLKQYVGEQFLRVEEKPMSTKSYVRHLFQDKEWIGTKVKPDVKLHPVSELISIRVRADFVFKNGLWNIMQTLPSEDRISDWFAEYHMLIESFKEKTKMYVIYDKTALEDAVELRRTLKYLDKKGVQDIELKSEDFTKICTKIENEAKDISRVEDELIAM